MPHPAWARCDKEEYSQYVTPGRHRSAPPPGGYSSGRTYADSCNDKQSVVVLAGVGLDAPFSGLLPLESCREATIALRHRDVRVPCEPGRFLADRDATAGAGGTRAQMDEADLVIVNTCSVTATADHGARQMLRRVARLNPEARVVATGCYATRAGDEIAALPGSPEVVPNEEKDALVDRVLPPLTDVETTAERFWGRPRRVRCAGVARCRRPGSLHAPSADRVRRAVRLLHHPVDPWTGPQSRRYARARRRQPRPPPAASTRSC